MGVLFFEGFETVGTETGNANRSTVLPRAKLRWTGFEGASPGSDARGYLAADFESTGFCWRSADSGGTTFHAWHTFPQAIQDIISVPGEQSGQTPKTHILGGRVHIRSTSATQQILQLQYKSNTGNDSFGGHLNLNVVNSTDLQLRRGSTVLATATAALTAGQWHYIEIKFLISDTAGAQTTNGLAIVHVDGVEVINFTGDTDGDLWTNTTSRDYVGFRWDFTGGSDSSSTDFWALDDCYALFPEGESAPYDDFLGPCRVVRFALDGDGSPLDWTPSTVGDHYVLVDENGANASDYVESDTDGQIDDYTMANFGGGGTVFAVKAEAEAVNTSGGTPSLKVRIDSNSTAYVVSDTVNYAVFTHYEDVAGFDSSQAGIEFDSGL